MPVNNALTPEGQNSLGAAFGYFPQLRRNRTVQDPRLAADVPLQFLRSRAAVTLGAPSDILNFLRSPLPMEVAGDVDYGPQVQVPYGSQELLRTLPLPPQGAAQQAAGNVGAVVPLSPAEALAAARAARQAALATGRAVGPAVERMAADYLQRQGLILPLDVYHGTPHTLPPTARNPLGEFDASKIGTGEGAQVYGRGIYTAENPAVGMKYKDQLGTQMQYKGQQFYDPIVGRKTATTGNTEIDDYLLSYLGDTGVVRKELLNAAKEMRASKNPQALKEYQTLMSEFRKIRPDVTAANTGNLYKADLPDVMISKMLDWDKPLSQQPEIMKALTPETMGLKLRVAPSGYMGYVSPDGVPIGLQVKGATPENFRKKWLDRIAEFGEAEGGAGRVIGYLGGTSETSAAQVSAALRQAGIPGIKYLDEGSRNLANTWIVKSPKGGENVFSNKESAEAFLKRNPGDTLISPKVTRNFVTFPGEEKNLTILERNGQSVNALQKNKR